MSANFALYEEEFRELEATLRRLLVEANAKVAFLIDANGQMLVAVGDVAPYDTTSLAALVAGNVAIKEGRDKLIEDREISVLFHEGERDHINLSIVASRVVLVVIFGDNTSLGLVRLRLKRAKPEFERLITGMVAKMGETGNANVIPEISDAAINALFGD